MEGKSEKDMREIPIEGGVVPKENIYQTNYI
jgi:hypothetical protein